MTKMKKIISIILIVILSASLSVGITLAYLTDRDSDVNVFTLGNVDIELKEDFQQGSALKPNLDINKDVQIENVGANDAWVWYTYAIPAALDAPADASANVLHVNHAGANWLGYQDNQNYWAEGQTEPTPEDQCWIVDYNPEGNGNPVGSVEVNGVAYNVYAVLYNGILPVNKTTTIGMTNVYLDAHVDIAPDGQVYTIQNGIPTKVDWNIKTNLDTVIFVNAYAVQARGFATVYEAYQGYIDQWGNLNGEMELTRLPYVGNLRQLQTALDEGWEEIILTNDIQLTGEVSGTFRLNVNKGQKLTLDLHGYTISNNTDRTDKNGNNILFNVAGAELTIIGNGQIISNTGEGDDSGLFFAGKDAVLTIEDGLFHEYTHYGVWAGQNSKVTIKDGTFRSEGIELIYANSTASVEIYGGHFSNTKAYQMLNLKDGQSARITTYGGTYLNQNPSATGDGNFVPAGYKVVSSQLANGGIEYTVLPE